MGIIVFKKLYLKAVSKSL